MRRPHGQISNAGIISSTTRNESILLVRDRADESTRISMSAVIVERHLRDDERKVPQLDPMPYHAWTYDLQGKLIGAPTWMKRGFRRDDHPLHRAALNEWEASLHQYVRRARAVRADLRSAGGKIQRLAIRSAVRATR